MRIPRIWLQIKAIWHVNEYRHHRLGIRRYESLMRQIEEIHRANLAADVRALCEEICRREQEQD